MENQNNLNYLNYLKSNELVSNLHQATSINSTIHHMDVKRLKIGHSSAKNLNNFISFVKVNGIIYHIYANQLFENEPNTNLINHTTHVYKTTYNYANNTLEYLEPVKYFDKIVDYINGYNVQLILESVYNHNALNMQYCIREFTRICYEFKLFELIEHIKANYPIIKIDEHTFILNKPKLYSLEPQNILLQKMRLVASSHYIFRDLNIFKTYLYDYIIGILECTQAVNAIKNVKNDHQLYAKIIDDLKFYRLENLLKAVIEA